MKFTRTSAITQCIMKRIKTAKFQFSNVEKKKNIMSQIAKFKIKFMGNCCGLHTQFLKNR